MARRAVPALGGLLVLFHAWLLVGQLWDGQLAEPGLLARWLIAVGLVGALAGLRRRGVSMFRGRQAVAIWLLAGLLHGPAVAGDAVSRMSPGLPETVTVAVQLAASAAFGLGLLLAAALSFRMPPRALQTARLTSRRPGRAVDAGCLVPFAPRPPPFAPSVELA